MMAFYVLKVPKHNTPEDRLGGIRAIKAEGFSTGEAVRCPRCNRPLSMLKWLPPYRIELETWGREYGDFADIGQDIIVSERFVRAFQDSGLRGLSLFEPVEIVKVTHHVDSPKQPPPRYFTAGVALNSTTVDQQASGYVWTDESKVCSVCLWDTLKRYARIVIKQETWNGDDIFFPRGGTGPLVSERFRLFCERHRFLNVIFKSADQECADFFPWESQGENSKGSGVESADDGRSGPATPPAAS